MEIAFDRPRSLTASPFRYCPGCGHSLIHRLIGECIDELRIRDIVVGIAPVGCAVFAYDYFNFDIIEAAHGRPPAVATALKRVLPGRIIFSYQGDGDLAAIGTAEIIHSACRGENISVFFVNNATYGMTGGQMAPTTIPGQRTTTTPRGRSLPADGFTLKVSELISAIEGASFVQRVSLHSHANVVATKGAIMKAFRYQIAGRGFSFVEILSPCPTDWGMLPVASAAWINDFMINAFPLGIIKDKFRETI
ncbi:MAG: 2-oxoglutarate oxidoreductase [Nitrospirae bacterium]|nr:2-oxoglutarate oxidoreductase [Nitrospirota bacterium]